MHGTTGTLSAGDGKTRVEGRRFGEQLFSEGLFLAASLGAFIVVRLCKSGERPRASTHNIQLLRDIHKHLNKQ